jgi:hypothetical protein
MDGGNFGRIGGPSYVAGATIAPFTIVKHNTTPRQVIPAAAATDILVGIAQPGQLGAPGVAGSSTVIAATVGLAIDVITGPNVAKVTLGTGGCTAGDQLTSDASGNAVTAVATNYVIGKALETGNAGDLVDCFVWPGRF